MLRCVLCQNNNRSTWNKKWLYLLKWLNFSFLIQVCLYLTFTLKISSKTSIGEVNNDASFPMPALLTLFYVIENRNAPLWHLVTSEYCSLKSTLAYHPGLEYFIVYNDTHVKYYVVLPKCPTFRKFSLCLPLPSYIGCYRQHFQQISMAINN